MLLQVHFARDLGVVGLSCEHVQVERMAVVATGGGTLEKLCKRTR